MTNLTLISGGLDFSDRDNEFLYLIERDLERNLHIYTNQEYCLKLWDAIQDEKKKRGLK